MFYLNKGSDLAKTRVRQVRHPEGVRLDHVFN